MSSELFSTKQRILDAAEELFASHGFAGASLRQVTSSAQVNLAAVNYHFGSKENLINEVLRLRLDKLNADRIQALQAALAKPSTRLEDVLDAWIRPALAVSSNEKGGTAFVRILARTYAEQNERLRTFLHDNYGHVLRDFANALSALLPNLDKQELYWRMDIITGALTFAMADFGTIKRRGVSAEEHRDLTADHLIQFAAAGLRAE
jgi:AcrR family transcriptional regulator